MSDKNDARRKVEHRPVQVFIPIWLHDAWRHWLADNHMNAREAMIYMIQKLTGAKEPQDDVSEKNPEL